MENIVAKFNEKTKKLTLEIDCSKVVGPTKEGKSMLIAKTGGFAKLDMVPGIPKGWMSVTIGAKPEFNGL